VEGIASEMEGKTLVEVKGYNDTFWDRYEEVAAGAYTRSLFSSY